MFPSSFGRKCSHVATFSSKAGGCLLVNLLAPSICNYCAWNLPKQLQAFGWVKCSEQGLSLVWDRRVGASNSVALRGLVAGVNIRAKWLIVACWLQL
jgi:hypothetical protein